MTSKTTFIVQAFEMRRGLQPGKREPAPTESGAKKRAEAWGAREKGSAAIKVVADDETGEVSEATILSQHGDVPQDFADQLKGG